MINSTVIEVPVQAVTNVPNHHFFGYYDQSPWNKTGRFMLAMEVDSIDHMVEEEDKAVIGVIDLNDNNSYRAIAETCAWNWQQGCMLQWLPPTHDRYIVYNDRQNGRFVSMIIDINTNERKVLPMPMYSLHPSGRYAITLNFARLHHTRKGYGYAGIEDSYYDEAAPEKDGIFLLDMKSGEYKLIISLSQLYGHDHLGVMEDGKHQVCHLTFNEDGSRFCFVHRFNLADGGMYTRLFTANIDGSELCCLLDSGYFSHFGWRHTHELLGYGRLPNRVNSIRKNRWLTRNILKHILPMYHSVISANSTLRRKILEDTYLLFEDQSPIVRRIGNKLLHEDGHCSWSPEGNWILTDTYPDKDLYRTLILYNYEKNRRIDIGRFYSLPDAKYLVDLVEVDWEISGMRCDLHPRWKRDGRQVCIDSVHEGSRQMYILDVAHILEMASGNR